MRAAIIQNGVVVNVTTITPGTLIQIPGYIIVISDTANIGDLWDGFTFTTPPEQPEPGEGK